MVKSPEYDPLPLSATQFNAVQSKNLTIVGRHNKEWVFWIFTKYQQMHDTLKTPMLGTVFHLFSHIWEEPLSSIQLFFSGFKMSVNRRASWAIWP